MEFAVGKPADDTGTRPCEFPWLLPPLYKQVEVRQGWQDKQPGTHWSTAVCVEREWLAAAARAWSWFPCWGSWCCSCAAPRKVSDLGRSAPRRAPGAAGSWQHDEAQLEGNGFSKVCCLIRLFCHEGAGWLRLNSECPRQPGSVGQWGLLTLLLSFTPAQSNRDCCLSYTKVRLPRWALKGYTEQLSSEVCDIPAIM